MSLRFIKWPHVITFVIISFLISEVYTIKIGPFPVNTQQLALIIVTFIGFSRRSILSPSCRSLSIVTGVYLAVAGLSHLYSEAPRQEITAWVTFLISLAANWVYLVAICRIGCSRNKIQNIEIVFKWLIRIAVFEVALSGAQFITRKPLISSIKSLYNESGVIRPMGTFRDPNYLGFFLAVCALWVYSSVCVKIVTKKKGYFLFTLFLFGIFLSRSLSSILAFLTGIVVVIFFRYNLFKMLRAIGSFVGFLVLFLNIVLLFFPYHKSLGYFEKKIALFSPDKFEKNARLNHLVAGWNMFKEYPITGHGYGTFNRLGPFYTPDKDFLRKRVLSLIRRGQDPNQVSLISHVFFATLIAELGIIGIIVFACMAWVVLRRVLVASKLIKRELTSRSGKPLYIALLLFFAGFTALYFVRMLGYGFRLSDSFIINFFVMGMLLIDGRISCDSPARSKATLNRVEI